MGPGVRRDDVRGVSLGCRTALLFAAELTK
jgi:hypothetical protein